MTESKLRERTTRRGDNPSDIEKQDSANKSLGKRGGKAKSLIKRLEGLAQSAQTFIRSLKPKHYVILALLAMCVFAMHKNNIFFGERGFLVKKVTNISRFVTQTQFYLHFWTYISPGAHTSWLKAKNYYETQRPLFEKAAREFELHPYWSQTKGIDSVNKGWYEMISLRAKAMADMYENEGKDDFKIEKDKCEMYRFFHRNQFRTAKIYGYWDDYKVFTRELFDNKAIPANSSWPNFIKSCHLTQGSSESTKMFKSRKWMHDNRRKLTKFIEDKWVYRADDWERPWAKDMNKLTDSLTPGIMLQGPFSTSYDDMGKHETVVELKVETFWGRAYLASVNFGRDTIILRDGSIEVFPSWWQNKVNAHTESPYNTWIREEGHLEKVWELAETAAKIMGIDQVRIDIFIKKGDPNAIAINENSISSGMGYRAHFEFMPKIWAEGHSEHWYKDYKGPAVDKPVYELSYPDRQCPNLHLIHKEPPYV
mmetsp:Transcript_24230/g.42891  ORF Transcript_24230/g.42891 Transcript_24230/m.42891 type:complete len:481 (+) Transcript_24230:220-1662(+)